MVEDEDTEEFPITLPPPGPGGIPPSSPHAPSRSTVRDSWEWMWRDALGRILPFVVAGGMYARLSHKANPYAGEAGDSAVRDMLLGLAIGVPVAATAAQFRAFVAPKYRLPTARDQALQTAYYFAVNAPAEEIFWRGTVQPVTIRILAHVPGMRSAARPLGWALTTAAFGAYHRLGHWSWRAIAGVTAAGGLFGALALMRPRRSSLLLPTLVHGFATAGFLSWGDAALDLHRRWRLWRARPSHARSPGGAEAPAISGGKLSGRNPSANGHRFG